jgi:hypothetical protein
MAVSFAVVDDKLRMHAATREPTITNLVPLLCSSGPNASVILGNCVGKEGGRGGACQQRNEEQEVDEEEEEEEVCVCVCVWGGGGG